MLSRQKIHQFSSLLFRGTNRVVLVGLAILITVGSAGVTRLVHANDLENQMRALQQENVANRAAVKDLVKSATSYQGAIDQLKAQISQLQGQIGESEAQKNALEQQILAHEIELDKQRAVLGSNIKSMYIGGEMSTIEMLATSKDLGDFVDKEAYRTAVQRQVQDTMSKIAKLQDELKDKKEQINILLESLQVQRATVDASRAEQANLLAMNQQQQAEFNSRTKDNQAKIVQLQRQIDEQRSLNSRTVYTDGGIYFIRFPGAVHNFNPDAYPYKNYGFSMRPEGCGYFDSNTGQTDATDRWGYCTRQCVSFTAWAVEASGRIAPKYYGNAKNWVSAAPSSYVYRSPQVGDVAITTSGAYGHAMYVAAVSGNKFLAWEYNQGLRGEFKSSRWITWR